MKRFILCMREVKKSPGFCLVWKDYMNDYGSYSPEVANILGAEILYRP